MFRILFQVTKLKSWIGTCYTNSKKLPKFVVKKVYFKIHVLVNFSNPTVPYIMVEAYFKNFTSLKTYFLMQVIDSSLNGFKTSEW